MRPLLIAALALLAVAPATASVRWHRHYATAYCLQGRMANGRYVHPGAVASNVYRLGTKVRFSRPIFGRRDFVVSDTGGALGDGHFDVWTSSCSTARWWGRRRITYRVMR